MNPDINTVLITFGTLLATWLGSKAGIKIKSIREDLASVEELQDRLTFQKQRTETAEHWLGRSKLALAEVQGECAALKDKLKDAEGAVVILQENNSRFLGNMLGLEKKLDAGAATLTEVTDLSHKYRNEAEAYKRSNANFEKANEQLCDQVSRAISSLNVAQETVAVLTEKLATFQRENENLHRVNAKLQGRDSEADVARDFYRRKLGHVTLKFFRYREAVKKSCGSLTLEKIAATVRSLEEVKCTD